MSTKLTSREIDKQLQRKDINPALKQSIEQKKSILSKDKTVKK